ncbi:MAG: primosomal protein N' [Alphaproteobacteria bacterium]|jgi:primosomal protein N' (replication factor Y)|nr:primosomal protein N' [Alphaproteobacteria bacterium]
MTSGEAEARANSGGRADDPAGWPGTDRVAVVLPLPLSGPYDYRMPEAVALQPGDFVQVPLGRRELPGLVWGAASGEVDEAKLRRVIRRFDMPPLPADGLRFLAWVARYVMAPLGAVAKMAMSVPEALAPPEAPRGYRLAPAHAGERDYGLAPHRATPARRRVLALLAEGPARLPAELAREAGCSPAVVKGLAELGLVESVPLGHGAAFRPPDPGHAPVTLNADQAAAAEALAGAVRQGGYGATLLDGVTGSGKTEVYFEAIAAALQAGRQVLVLVPEIALSAQWLERFAARFGVPPAEWHSDLSAARRRETWRAVAFGKARVVVGARSALFLPFAALGLIIVDEEHETAFKQEDGVLYNARDMAVVRAHLGNFPIVLVSATPSLETMVNVETGRYGRVQLPSRHGGARLPELAAVDMRAEPAPRGQFLSPVLARALAETLAAGEQSLLFLNRRGYAPLTLCRACGLRVECGDCSAWLVEHRLIGRLKCHHCGFSRPTPQRCPHCRAADSFVACGPGVERIAEEVQASLPQARLALMTSDSFHGPAEAQALVQQITQGAVDVIIGTQLVAKGHHFPQLTLVGVVDADLGLAGGDLRAGERTFQLLHQVAGRAGRAERPGRVLLQTYQPEHPVLAALVAGDRDTFLAEEAAARETRGWPPFGRLAGIIVSGRDRPAVEQVAQELGRAAPRGEGIEVLGPAEAPLALLRGRHRRRLLVKAAKGAPLQGILADWLMRVPVPNAVRVTVDIDPYSFL